MTKSSLTSVPSLSEIIDEGIMPSNEFKINFDNIKIGDYEERNISLNFCYDRYGNLNITHNSKGNMHIALKAPNSQILVSSDITPKEIEMLFIGTNISDNCGFPLMMTPKQSPVTLKVNDSATQVSAYLLNGPELLCSGGSMTFSYENYEISVRTFTTTQDLRRNVNHHRYDYVVTHELILKNLSDDFISADSALKALGSFSNFLTFVRGGYCGLGHIQGVDKNLNQSYNFLGFTKCDHFKMEVGWFEAGMSNCLPDLYTQYCKLIEDSERTYVTLRSIEFYRASNSISVSTKEVALISSFAALETLVPHILATKAGWSKDLMRSKSKFVDQLRAASAFIGLSAELFEHAPNLKQKLSEYKNLDEFDLLGIFRNRIVHQEKKFKYTGIELYEIWCFAQWLIEIFIFSMIGYKKEMNDRRKYSGWSGMLVQVPI